MATINPIGNGLSGVTGSGKFVGDTSPTFTGILVSPTIQLSDNYILDSNGNVGISIVPSASAVNYVQLIDSATAANPGIAANGTDTNIGLNIVGKGTGGANVHGTSTNDSAAEGYVGELISSVVEGSPVSITTATSTNLTSISLTAGDWDVYGNITATLSSGTNFTQLLVWISSTSATTPGDSLTNRISTLGASVLGVSAPYYRATIAAPTTIYVSCYSVFAGGTLSGRGGIYARRVR